MLDDNFETDLAEYFKGDTGTFIDVCADFFTLDQAYNFAESKLKKYKDGHDIVDVFINFTDATNLYRVELIFKEYEPNE